MEARPCDKTFGKDHVIEITSMLQNLEAALTAESKLRIVRGGRGMN
jgi:hypothetical protein